MPENQVFDGDDNGPMADETNFVSWEKVVGKTQISILHSKGEGFDITLSQEGFGPIVMYKTIAEAVQADIDHLSALQAKLKHLQLEYQPIYIKDGLVDVWYTDEEKKEIRDTISVPWADQQCGNIHVIKLINDYLAALEIDGKTNLGYTNTWQSIN